MEPIFLILLIILGFVFAVIYIVNVYKIRINLSYLYPESRAALFKHRLTVFSAWYIPIAVVLEVLWVFYIIKLDAEIASAIFNSVTIALLIPFTIGTVFVYLYFMGIPDFQKLGIKSKIKQYSLLKDYYLAGFYSNSLAEFEMKKGNIIEELKWNLKALDYLVLFMTEKKLNKPMNGDKTPLDDAQKHQIAFILNVVVTLLHTMQSLKNYEKMSLVTQIGLQATSRFPEGVIDSSFEDVDLEIKRLIQEIKRFQGDYAKKKD